MRIPRVATSGRIVGLAVWTFSVAGIGLTGVATSADRPETTHLTTDVGPAAPMTMSARATTTQRALALARVTTVPTGPAGAPATTPSPGATTPTTAPQPDATTTLPPTTAAESPPPTTAAAPPTTTVAAPAPQLQPTPGSYPASVTGSASLNGSPRAMPSAGSVVIEQAGPSDQRQRTANGLADIDMTLRYSPASADLSTLRLSVSGITRTFQPVAGSAFLRFESGGGMWSWQVDSTDSKTHIVFAASVVREDVVTVDGRAVPVVVVEATLTITGDVVGTAHLTTWVAEIERLPLVQRLVLDARASMFGLTATVVSDVTTTLHHLAPS